MTSFCDDLYDAQARKHSKLHCVAFLNLFIYTLLTFQGGSRTDACFEICPDWTITSHAQSVPAMGLFVSLKWAIIQCRCGCCLRSGSQFGPWVHHKRMTSNKYDCPRGSHISFFLENLDAKEEGNSRGRYCLKDVFFPLCFAPWIQCTFPVKDETDSWHWLQCWIWQASKWSHRNIWRKVYNIKVVKLSWVQKITLQPVWYLDICVLQSFSILVQPWHISNMYICIYI